MNGASQQRAERSAKEVTAPVFGPTFLGILAWVLCGTAVIAALLHWVIAIALGLVACAFALLAIILPQPRAPKETGGAR